MVDCFWRAAGVGARRPPGTFGGPAQAASVVTLGAVLAGGGRARAPGVRRAVRTGSPTGPEPSVGDPPPDRVNAYQRPPVDRTPGGPRWGGADDDEGGSGSAASPRSTAPNHRNRSGTPSTAAGVPRRGSCRGTRLPPPGRWPRAARSWWRRRRRRTRRGPSTRSRRGQAGPCPAPGTGPHRPRGRRDQHHHRGPGQTLEASGGGPPPGVRGGLPIPGGLLGPLEDHELPSLGISRRRGRECGRKQLVDQSQVKGTTGEVPGHPATDDRFGSSTVAPWGGTLLGPGSSDLPARTPDSASQ